MTRHTRINTPLFDSPILSCSYPAVFINDDTQAGDKARLLNGRFQLHFDVDNYFREF
jgi:hypothetical protein